MSFAFRLVVSARRRLYDSGVFRARRLGHAVISVGNLTTGGTGKTPLVIALARRLRDEGYRPVILSRGYRRASSGILVVSRGNGPVVGCAAAGDEPFLIARRVPGAAVVVGSDRYLAGVEAERESLGNLFILDDGFQHRRLHRDIDIVTIDAAEWSAGERLLPWGTWREPQSAIERAHVACVQPRPDEPHTVELPIPTFTVHPVVDGIYDGEGRQIAPESITDPVVAFAGIAKPERFFATLEDLGVHIATRVRFRDHHAYTRADINQLGSGTRITTEKDAVRLEGLGAGPFLRLVISAKIDRMDELLRLIRGRLPTNS
ncbi:MAG TPA: tetraacyldisaccharide 4'-kinase [Terriglobia bacterium]|nr:tetraacyldisaccharide 4'-kinase [Terriglobia bacterium]